MEEVAIFFQISLDVHTKLQGISGNRGEWSNQKDKINLKKLTLKNEFSDKWHKITIIKMHNELRKMMYKQNDFNNEIENIKRNQTEFWKCNNWTEKFTRGAQQ